MWLIYISDCSCGGDGGYGITGGSETDIDVGDCIDGADGVIE